MWLPERVWDDWRLRDSDLLDDRILAESGCDGIKYPCSHDRISGQH